MQNKKKICVITASRAEYGLLKKIMHGIVDSNKLELQLIVTGTHLSHEYGMTVSSILDDGFVPDYSIDILEEDSSAIATTNAISKIIKKLPNFLEILKPDLLLVLGDRFEIFGAVASALIYKIPVGHIHGGEVTEGAFDESLRHSITKLSHIHFTSTKGHKLRVEQLGEDPDKVFNVGAPGIEAIKSLKLLSMESVQKLIGVPFKEKNYLITFHPETLEDSLSPKEQINNLLRCLENEKNTSFIFTKANADPGGRIINEEIKKFVEQNANKASLHSSLGQLNYLSTMKFSSAVIGNSSSGIIEAPSLKVPVINIGSRQKGRTKSVNIINCENSIPEISNAFDQLKSLNIDSINNLYDGGNTSEMIIKIIEDISLDSILKKKFIDI
jgi:GDP/UDP-N,N'-diacetylbacillosamine 2-epimerase (hydrolysing)